MPKLPLLITVPMSHYCEKARWALEHAGVAHRERGRIPVVHRFQGSVRGSFTVPVLVSAGGTLRDSARILAHADRACPPERRLYPAEPAERREVERLVAGFDERYGPSTRRWFYSWCVRDRTQFLHYLSPGLDSGQVRAFRLVRPGAALILRVYFSLGSRARAEEAARIDAELAAVSALLADGRRYLVGDRFSAADLTFAALSAPALMPPGYGGGHFVAPTEPPAEQAEQVAAWRATPAGQLALRVYRDHRLTPAAAG